MRSRSLRAAAGTEVFPAQVCVVLGTQWGDEGKGKLVDILAQQYDVVARAQVRGVRGIARQQQARALGGTVAAAAWRPARAPAPRYLTPQLNRSHSKLMVPLVTFLYGYAGYG